ncbi:MAG: HAMP domain-containing protein, partial [Actinobacteria bacterium]|nr:HAMP domain-containing protein [Actinomycetota bacterium]
MRRLRDLWRGSPWAGVGAARTRLGLPRPTIRLKLTLWYGAMFLLAGLLLLSLTYVLVRQGFEPSPRAVREAVAERLGIPPGRLEERPPAGQNPVFPDLGQMRRDLTIGRLLREIQAEQMTQQLRGLLMWSGVALGIVAVVSLGLGWAMAGRLLRPVHDLTALARTLSERTLHERIRLRRPNDELKELADTFDAMLERLDVAFASQRDFVANASHELRTPLTIIRTELDVALADPDLSREELEAMAAAVRSALQRSEDVLASLLALARSETPVELRRVDLAVLAEESVARYSTAAEARGLRADLALGAAVVEGDRALLARMLDNLVENAIRHNEDNGWFMVQTTLGEDRATVTVANGG